MNNNHIPDPHVDHAIDHPLPPQSAPIDPADEFRSESDFEHDDPADFRIDDLGDSDSDRWRLTNPKRLGLIVCALAVFLTMTLVILVQLYSSSYSVWKSYGAHGMRDGLFVSRSDDKRRFEVLTLWNGLEVLLIADPSADKAAAAMDLGVGSSLDPPGYLGLAHFHEHMLFLGSSRYRSEAAFSSFISMNGGRNNAFTENEHTNFFFEVDADHLEHALDVWSRFFIDPLLSAKWMDKEVHAVDAEYKKDVPSQQWRGRRMFEVAANPKNPFHRFTVGSIGTLTRSGDVHREMVRFHRRWVKAQIMKLVVVGKQDLRLSLFLHFYVFFSLCYLMSYR